MGKSQFPAGKPVKFDSPAFRPPINASVKPGGAAGAHLESPARENNEPIHDDPCIPDGSGVSNLTSPAAKLGD